MTKTKSKILIAIASIAILICSLFTGAVLYNRKDNVVSDGVLNAANGSANVTINDSNGSVAEADKTKTGVPIGNVQQLKDFLNGAEPVGYLTQNIDTETFIWDSYGSGLEFAKDRVLDGNGFKVKISMKESGDEYQMLTGFKILPWRDALAEKKGGSYSQELGASGVFMAVNQGTIKNINFVADLIPKGLNAAKNIYGYEWVPAGARGTGNRDANTKPLSFGLVTGVNFGDITNCSVDYIKGSDIRLQNLNERNIGRWAKEDKNNIEFGCVAGVNSGEISYASVNFDGRVDIQVRATNLPNAQVAGSGTCCSRAIFGGIVGRMQSDSKDPVNHVKHAQATLYNSIITGSGSAYLKSEAWGGTATDKIYSYRHMGAAVGGNSPYSGTVVKSGDGMQKSYGIVDGIISTFTGNLTEGGASTSGEVPGQTYRAIIDCGKISNVTFLDNYTGHIDNCGCKGDEHIATRANGIVCDYGVGNISVGFDKNSPRMAGLLVKVTPQGGADDVIYSVVKEAREVDVNGNLVGKAKANLFSYDNLNYHDTYNAVERPMVSKQADMVIPEPRALDDYVGFLLHLEYGKLVEAVYAPATGGVETTDSDPDVGLVPTYSYDYQEKGVAKIVRYGETAAGTDTFEENTKYRQFVAEVRQENDKAYIPAQQGIIFPGVYKNVYIQATLSKYQAYVDADYRYVAKLEVDQKGDPKKAKLKITPANIVASTTDTNYNVGGAGLDKNDVAPNKLVVDTFNQYTFNFDVFTLNNDKTVRTKLEVPSETVTKPYDAIECSYDGYDWFTAVTYDELTKGYTVNESTPKEGKNFFFRAVKRFLKADGTLLYKTAVTSASKIYILKIDGDAPVITATILGGTDNGVDYRSWSKKDTWLSETFALMFTVNDATAEGLILKYNGTPVTLTNSQAGISFPYDGLYSFVATDKYGNVSASYDVYSKVDKETPTIDVKAVLADPNIAGNSLTINGSTATSGASVGNANPKVVNARDTYLKPELTNRQVSGVTYKYSPDNGVTWLTSTDVKGILCDRVIDKAYYADPNTPNLNIFDQYQIKAVSGAGIESAILKVQMQIQKGLLVVDPDTIIIPNGGWDKIGLRPSDMMKKYSGDDSLPSVLTTALANAFNLAAGRDKSQQFDKITVGGKYARVEVGSDIPISITVHDPLGAFTVDTSTMGLKGTITPAQVTVIVHDARREYGIDYCNFTYTVRGLIGSDTMDLSSFIKPGEGVTKTSPASATGYPITVPAKGTKAGNYAISAINNDAKMFIDPQKLDQIVYNDNYLDFSYDGKDHQVEATYLTPDGMNKPLGVTYYTLAKNSNGVYVPTPLVGNPIEIGQYRAIFSILDTTNYILDESRATLDFEVGRGFVNFAFEGVQPTGETFTIKYNNKDFVLSPIASNGGATTVTYFDGVNNPIVGFPKNAGSYNIRVEYNNSKESRPTMVGRYYDRVIVYKLVINKITYAEAGIAPNAIVKTFDNRPTQVILDNIPEGTLIPEDITLIPGTSPARYLALEKTEAGVYTKKFRLMNPNIIEQELTASITINKAKFVGNTTTDNAQVTSTTVSYDGQDHSIELLGLPQGINVSVMTDIGTSGGVELVNNKITKKEAGKYVANLRLSNRNYVTVTIQGILDIKPIDMIGTTITATKAVYDGKLHGLTISGIPSDVNMASKTTVDAIYDGKTVTLTSAVDPAHTIWYVPGVDRAGIHGVIVNIDNNNYNFKQLTSEINISKAAYATGGTKILSKTVVYNGNPQVLDITNLPAGTTVTTNQPNNAQTLTATNAGEYTLSASLENNNYINTTLTGTLVINKAAYDKVVTFAGFTADYDGIEKAITLDSTQLEQDSNVAFNVDGKDVVNVANTLKFKDAGTYNIKMTISHANFVDKVVNAQVVINKIAAPYAGSLVITDRTVAYNGKNQGLEITGAGEGCLVSAMYQGMVTANIQPTNAGVYNVDVTVSHRNYVDVVGKAILTITKGTMTLDGCTVESLSVDFDGLSHAVTVFDVNGMPLTPEYKAVFKYGDLPEGMAPINAGIYSVTARITKDNYEDYAVVEAGELIINKIASPELKMKNIDKKYNGKEQPIVIERVDGKDIGGYVAECTIDGKKYSSFMNVGTYACDVTVSQANYLDVVVKGTVKINPVEVVITYTGMDDTYAGKELALVGKYTGVDGAIHDVKFTFPEGYDGSKAGKYIATATFPDGNYVATEATATVEFVIKNANVAAIAGGTAGGVVLIGAGVGLFFILKKKRIKL